MKILSISDTHGLHESIKKRSLTKADVLIHAGDCTNYGSIPQIIEFINWFASLDKYKHKIFIAGNHDYGFEQYPQEIKEYLEGFPELTYLEDSSVIIDGVKFYGSPHTPYFHNWAFNCARNEEDAKIYNKPLITEYWDKIPMDTQVLITHGPPYGINDFVPYNGGEFVGCRDLLDKVYNMSDLKLNVHGHIHCGYGQQITNGVNYINPSIVTESYSPINKPIRIEI